MKQHSAYKKIVFLRLPEVMFRTGKSRSAIYRDISLGLFPKSAPIGSRSVAWDEADIIEWQLKQMKKI